MCAKMTCKAKRRSPVSTCKTTSVFGTCWGSAASNLINNAVRYTPAGGRVDVACGQNDSGTFIEVVDSGPGIPAVERERVFDRFYRRHGEEGLGSGGKSGSGLGLSIVRTIADRHGATVALSDARRGDASSGLRVTVLFPHAAHAGE